MKVIAIIPARYASTRFPGKPLADLGGVKVINRVVAQVKKAGIEAIVATDSTDIMDCVLGAGGSAVLTRDDHKSGTDRIKEAADKICTDADIIINVQGDEPFIRPGQIRQLAENFERYPDTDIATLAKRFDPALGIDALCSPNLVKVTFSDNMDALYFSRSVIPYVRGVAREDWLKECTFHTHLGIYAYRREVLGEVTRLLQSSLEKAESLEQLRWLQAGYRIKVGVTDFDTVGIDTPEDLADAERFLGNHPEFRL